MKSVLTVISDESLMSKMRIALSDETIKYFATTDVEEAMRIAEDNEIAVVIMDYKLPVMSGVELCETFIDCNPKMQIIVIFDDKYAPNVINMYNRFHLSKLICKEHLVLEDVPKLINDALYKYNRNEVINTKDSNNKKLNEKYMKPLNEISEVLNERTNGYQEILRTFIDCVKFVRLSQSDSLKSFSIYVDRIINDYIQLFMVNEPDYKQYFDSLTTSFNKPDKKKYFKISYEEVNIQKEIVKNILLMIDILTISFDTFFSMYRGKIALIEKDEYIVVNALYEVREGFEDIEGSTILNVCKNVIERFSDRLIFGKKEDTIQYKAVFNFSSNETSKEVALNG